ncbi:MAG: hypothetical protein ACI8W8_003045 [Rhodothermales bacterium]|jgi:hypothetical protein
MAFRKAAFGADARIGSVSIGDATTYVPGEGAPRVILPQDRQIQEQDWQVPRAADFRQEPMNELKLGHRCQDPCGL